MVGVTAIAALLLVSGDFEGTATVTAEGRAGRAPIIPGSEIHAPFAAGLVTPGAQLAYRDHRLELAVDYTLRGFIRHTYDAGDLEGGQNAPVWLHTGTLKLEGKATRQTSITADAAVSLGQADYTYLPQVVGTSQAALVQSAAPRFLAVSGGAAVTTHVARASQLQLDLHATHNRPLDAPADQVVMTPPVAITDGVHATAVFALPTSSSVTLLPSAKQTLSPADALTVSTSVAFNDLIMTLPAATGTIATSQDFKTITVVPRLAWRHRFERAVYVAASAGIAYLPLVDRPDPGPGVKPVDVTRFSPIGSVGLDARLLGERETKLYTLVTASVDYYHDPVLATSSPRALLLGSLTLDLPNAWTVALEGNLSTTLKAHPVVTGNLVTCDERDQAAGRSGTCLFPDETMAAAALAVRRALSDYLTLELGLRWADRGPQFLSPAAGFWQRQVWAYVSLRGTSRAVRRATTTAAE